MIQLATKTNTADNTTGRQSDSTGTMSTSYHCRLHAPVAEMGKMPTHPSAPAPGRQARCAPGTGSVSRYWIFALVQQPHHVLDRPAPRGDTGRLGGRLALEAYVRPAEGVVHEVDRHGGSQVLYLLR